jgi:hypothetical protein
MRKQAVSQMQNENEANVAAYFRIPNLLAESFVNKKLLRISEDRLHLRPFSRYQASIQIWISGRLTSICAGGSGEEAGSGSGSAGHRGCRPPLPSPPTHPT